MSSSSPGVMTGPSPSRWQGFVPRDRRNDPQRSTLTGSKPGFVRSRRTYAGMHTASSRAFNKIRAQLKQTERGPTLVIYEDCYALADLESSEQYRIFVRHVLPSERIWDGMFTVFLESLQPEYDWRLLHGYASMKLDLRRGPPDGPVKAISSRPKK